MEHHLQPKCLIEHHQSSQSTHQIEKTMATKARVSYAIIHLFVLLGPHLARAWLFTLSEGGCEELISCQDCVVEYALDHHNIRRPCTWCPATQTCEMMNQWTSKCAEGQTHRDVCPVLNRQLPRCVTFEYSFWICERARPQNPDRCDQSFVDEFCSQQTTVKSLQICNGASLTLETVGTVGFGQQDALTIAKTSYGLEVSLKYFWVNADAGEHRRRVQTTMSNSPVFLCNAQLRPDQATVVQYRTSTITASGSMEGTSAGSSVTSSWFATASISLIFAIVQMR